MSEIAAEHPQAESISAQVDLWLRQVVIGLNLCPFAAAPTRRGAVRIAVTAANTLEALKDALLDEIILLDETPDKALETTLLVIPNMLLSFEEYNQYLDTAEDLLIQYDRDGIYQIASFHPDYCFAGAAPDDSENLTNRSPYPILHLIREELMTRVLKHYPDPESIPERNIRCMNALGPEQKRQLFAYLY
jgi:hypothetical protein